MASASSERSESGEYLVVARRYRPQSFQDLVGQPQVSTALAHAIQTQRIGHAYLFTGARGVGKTSTARIFAKCLNCVDGPTPVPCNHCDICEGIAQGGDVDVLEIDGASNRGIDEIRQLRSNVHIRPSRARFKVYIIDEVHMLTNQAFNALLKTLEEPPEHVKFIFCTTDPEKIPITVLSRCQRFDFPPVEAGSIVERLRLIVDKEGMEADEEALQLLARRAAGSMRDSQSLLEQLLSFCDGRITSLDVHRMLGTAQDGRLKEFALALVARDGAAALRHLDAALVAGIDAGQLAEQLLGYFRDMMAAAVGCGPELMRYSSAADCGYLAELGRQWGVETLLAILQILDQAIVRMRQSTQTRVLLEVALVRISALEDLDDLGSLIARLEGGQPIYAGTPVPRTIVLGSGTTSTGGAGDASSRAAMPGPGATVGQPAASRPPVPQPNPAATGEKKTTQPAVVAKGADAERGYSDVSGLKVEAVGQPDATQLGLNPAVLTASDRAPMSHPGSPPALNQTSAEGAGGLAGEATTASVGPGQPSAGGATGRVERGSRRRSEAGAAESSVTAEVGVKGAGRTASRGEATAAADPAATVTANQVGTDTSGVQASVNAATVSGLGASVPTPVDANLPVKGRREGLKGSKSRTAGGELGAESTSSNLSDGPGNATAERGQAGRAERGAPLEKSQPGKGGPALSAADEERDIAGAEGEEAEPGASQASPEVMWRAAIARLNDSTADYGKYFESVAISAPNRLVVRFPARYTLQKERCERPQAKQRFEQALQLITGRTYRVDFELIETGSKIPPPKRAVSLRERQRAAERHPLVQAAIELFDAEIIRTEEPRQDAEPERE